jgi:hypothetical protein
MQNAKSPAGNDGAFLLQEKRKKLRGVNKIIFDRIFVC